jgi:hypothetical protein
MGGNFSGHISLLPKLAYSHRNRQDYLTEFTKALPSADSRQHCIQSKDGDNCLSTNLGLQNRDEQ